MERKLKYCPNCLGNDVTSRNKVIKPTDSLVKLTGSNLLPVTYYTMYKGFFTEFTYMDNSICPKCHAKLIEMHLTEDEWIILNVISLEQDFIFAMDKLKQEDIIEFTSKMTQFKEIYYQRSSNKSKKHEPEKKQSSVPKCPTCGSTNIKKISGTKRWVTTGMFGLGSSNVGKTMECGSCGYKW